MANNVTDQTIQQILLAKALQDPSQTQTALGALGDYNKRMMMPTGGMPPDAGAAELMQGAYPKGVPQNVDYEALQKRAEAINAIKMLQASGMLRMK